MRGDDRGLRYRPVAGADFSDPDICGRLFYKFYYEVVIIFD